MCVGGWVREVRFDTVLFASQAPTVHQTVLSLSHCNVANTYYNVCVCTCTVCTVCLCVFTYYILIVTVTRDVARRLGRGWG